ncbi:hypothetical protein OEG84_06170 [Hoeflea sp. G2-23]|uniref:Lipoprotein n=1 Tax=Hoeflea algicola TaxID=2983763 RepID=A0ABT3Z6B3_9HYPH|nr:hypothetical protein [Hoeflea algicola]MCY0147305.1 hypothetical protein [Hoeflea algicola]
MRSFITAPFVCLTLVSLALPLSGCGTYLVAKTVTNTGSLVVGGAVGAVKLTGRTAGAVVGIGGDSDQE